MKLITLFPAFLLLVSAAPAHADYVNAETRPDLKHLWAPAPPLPFQTTPEAFKKYLNQVSGLKILQVQGCEFSSLGKTRFFSTPDRSWSPEQNFYTCEQVFFEKNTDPWGTQRCMGKFWGYAMGSAPLSNGSQERFTAKTGWS